MNIRILVFAIICIISVSTAEAFEFRGHNYEWGAHINEVRKNEAALGDTELANDDPDVLTYVYDSKDGLAVATYQFKNKKLSKTALHIRLKYDSMTNHIVYLKIKLGYESSFGNPIEEELKNCLFISTDTYIYLEFDEDGSDSIVFVFGPISELDNKSQNDPTDAKNIKTASRPENIIAIHGFYIGMPLTEAVEIINSKFKAIFADTDMQITMIDAEYELFRKKSSIKPIEINIGRVKNYSGYVTNYYLKFDQCFIFGKTIFNGTESSFIADEHGKLIEMYLSNSEVNKMFNVADMKADSFVQAFVNAYKISQMKSVWEGTSMKWEYTSPEGFKISIKDDKSIKMEKAIKAKERNFS